MNTTEELLKILTPQEQENILRYTRLLPILKGEPEDGPAVHFDRAMRSEIEAGTLTAEKFNGYLAAIEAVTKTGQIRDNNATLQELDCDIRVLEVTLDRFLNETLYLYLKIFPAALVRELHAAADIYNTYSEAVREKIDAALKAQI